MYKKRFLWRCPQLVFIAMLASNAGQRQSGAILAAICPADAPCQKATNHRPAAYTKPREGDKAIDLYLPKVADRYGHELWDSRKTYDNQNKTPNLISWGILDKRAMIVPRYEWFNCWESRWWRQSQRNRSLVSLLLTRSLTPSPALRKTLVRGRPKSSKHSLQSPFCENTFHHTIHKQHSDGGRPRCCCGENSNDTSLQHW